MKIEKWNKITELYVEAQYEDETGNASLNFYKTRYDHKPILEIKDIDTSDIRLQKELDKADITFFNTNDEEIITKIKELGYDADAN